MRIILDFDEDEAEAARTAIDGDKWRDVVWDLYAHMRQMTKRGEVSDVEHAIYDDVRAVICQLVNDSGLNLDP